MLTIGGLFSGIGGIEYAFTAAGFDVSWLVEIDPFCQRVLRKHWPHARIFGDVHTVGNHNLAPVDVLVAGFPCQPFSIAGDLKGEDDPRHLWPQLYRVIGELRPAVIFLENVGNLRNVAHGTAFRKILRQLAESGYDAEWACLRASDFGAPHQRERLFIVAYTCEFRRPESQTVSNPTCDPEWNNKAHQSPGNAEPDAIISGGQTLGDSHSGRQEQCQPEAGAVHLSDAGCAAVINANGTENELSQSGLGTDASRLSARLVGHRWPAGQGTFQYDYEPPRTTPESEPERRTKVGAIGNSVVPQCVYPIALTIMEYLCATTT